MRLHFSLVLASAVASFIGADAPPAAPSPIRLPVGPIVPPSPGPSPDAVVKLTAGLHYVIDCKIDCVVRAHPTGLVKVVKKKGPRDISAKFVDGNGREEDRTYDGPFIYDITAIGTGRVEIDVIPLGFKAEADIVSTTVDVDSGQAPIPPPKPVPPDVIPDPPKPPAPGAKLFAVVLQDRLTADPAQAQALASKIFRDYLAAGSHEMEIVDIGTVAGKKRLGDFQKTLDKAKVSPPAWVVMTADGTVYIAASLPSKDTDLVDALKKVTGK